MTENQLDIRTGAAHAVHKRRRSEEICDPARVLQIDIGRLVPNRSQPRMYFESNATIRLADSIRRYGILQPLTVRLLEPDAAGDTEGGGTSAGEHAMFEIVAGERRYRAARMLGLKSVPCVMIEADDRRSAELALIENLLREDLNMFETAHAIRRLIDEFCLTQEEVARRLTMSQSAVANKLRLLRYTEREQETILTSGLTERHARALLKLDEPEQRLAVMEHIVAYHLNVSATEAYLERLTSEPEEAPDPARRQKPVIKDIRLFYNSVDHAVDVVKAAGIDISSRRHEDETGVTIEIRIPHPRGCFT